MMAEVVVEVEEGVEVQIQRVVEEELYLGEGEMLMNLILTEVLMNLILMEEEGEVEEVEPSWVVLDCDCDDVAAGDVRDALVGALHGVSC